MPLWLTPFHLLSKQLQSQRAPGGVQCFQRKGLHYFLQFKRVLWKLCFLPLPREEDLEQMLLLCVIWKVEGAPILLCLGGQGSFLLNNTSPGWQIENPGASWHRDSLLSQALVCWSTSPQYLCSVSSATAMVCPWSCWGWALLCYPLVFTFLLLYFTCDLGMPAALPAAALSSLSLFSVIQVCTSTALTTRDGTECAKNRNSTTGRGIYSAY